MREILFRGKDEYGKWVYGYFTRRGMGETIIWERGTGIPVYSDTIGQYTGELDRNGVKIFEGDVIKFKRDGKEMIDVVVFKPPMFSPSRSMRWSLDRDEVIGNIYDNPELLASMEDRKCTNT